MQRAISFLLALAAAGQVACGSSGSTPGSAYFTSEPGRAPPPNTQQSELNPTGPTGNANQPLPSPTTPPTNPNAPPLPDQNQATGSTGFVPGQNFCSTICASVAESPCYGECRGRCGAYLVLYSRCPSQVGAAASCVQQGGFTCDDQGQLHLASEQCDVIVAALDSCGSSTNPLPTSTGFPADPPATFDGGR